MLASTIATMSVAALAEHLEAQRKAHTTSLERTVFREDSATTKVPTDASRGTPTPAVGQHLSGPWRSILQSPPSAVTRTTLETSPRLVREMLSSCWCTTVKYPVQMSSSDSVPDNLLPCCVLAMKHAAATMKAVAQQTEVKLNTALLRKHARSAGPPPTPVAEPARIDELEELLQTLAATQQEIASEELALKHLRESEAAATLYRQKQLALLTHEVREAAAANCVAAGLLREARLSGLHHSKPAEPPLTLYSTSTFVQPVNDHPMRNIAVEVADFELEVDRLRRRKSQLMLLLGRLNDAAGVELRRTALKMKAHLPL